MKETILLIEDDQIMRENTSEMLELAGYTVETAENGMYGVEKAKRYKPDLIICDIMMPDLDGYGVLYLLSNDNELRDIPFVFLTAKAERTDMRKGMELGADDYLPKPFEEDELLKTVEMRLKKKAIFKSGFENNVEGLFDFLNEAKGLEELEKLSTSKEVKQYRKGELIYRVGGSPKGIYYIIEGKVKVQRSNEFSKEIVTGLFNDGEFFGYESVFKSEKYETDAEVLADSKIVFISSEDFLKLVYCNRDVSSLFIKMLSNNIIEKEEKLLTLAYESVRKRTAESLLEFYKRFRKDNDASGEVAISRKDLASMAGTATESLIRALSDLKDGGFISVKGRKITILDEEGLANLNW